MVSSLLPFPGSGAAPALPRWRNLQGRNSPGCPSASPCGPHLPRRCHLPWPHHGGAFNKLKGRRGPLLPGSELTCILRQCPPHSQLLFPAAGMHQPYPKDEGAKTYGLCKISAAPPTARWAGTELWARGAGCSLGCTGTAPWSLFHSGPSSDQRSWRSPPREGPRRPLQEMGRDMESSRSCAWLSGHLTPGQLLPARRRLGTHSLITPLLPHPVPWGLWVLERGSVQWLLERRPLLGWKEAAVSTAILAQP